MEVSIAGKLSASIGSQIDSARNAFALRSDRLNNLVESVIERVDGLEIDVRRLCDHIPDFTDGLQRVNSRVDEANRSNQNRIEQFSARIENGLNEEVNDLELRINDEVNSLRQMIDNNQEAYVRRMVYLDTRSIDRLAGLSNDLEDLRECVLSLRRRFSSLNSSSSNVLPESDSIVGIRSVGEIAGSHPAPAFGGGVPPSNGPDWLSVDHSSSPRLARPTPTLSRRTPSPPALSNRSHFGQQRLATPPQNGATMSGSVPSHHFNGSLPVVRQPQPSPRSRIGQVRSRPTPTPRVVDNSLQVRPPLPTMRQVDIVASGQPSSLSLRDQARGRVHSPGPLSPSDSRSLTSQSINQNSHGQPPEIVRPQFIPSQGRDLPSHSMHTHRQSHVTMHAQVTRPGPSLADPLTEAVGLHTVSSQGEVLPPHDSRTHGFDLPNQSRIVGHRTPPLASSEFQLLNPGNDPPPSSPSSSSSSGSGSSGQPLPVDRSQAVNRAGSERIGRISRRLEVCSGLIKRITDKNLEGLSKSQVMELVTYDLKTLQELKRELSDIEKKLDSLQCDGVSSLLDMVDDSIYACRRFEGELEDLRKLHFLHLSADKSLLKKLELTKFDGKAENDTVYSFLTLFYRLTDGQYCPMDQASLLFTTYLSESIQREVEPFKNSLDMIKQHLITKYGDLRNVADSKVKAMSKVKHPGQSIPSQVDYYKRILQLLLHLETLMASEFVNSTEIRGVIHSASYVNNIVALLPESIEHEYCRSLQNEPKIPPPSGERMFLLLKKTLEDGLGYLNSRSNIRQYAGLGSRQDSSKPKAVHLVDSGSDCSSPANVRTESPAKRSKKRSVNTASVQKPISFPCHFHSDGDAKKNGKHDLGYCKSFFEMKAEDRFRIAKQQALCFTCLKPECRKVSAKACISDVPDGLICKECAKGSYPRTLNVLLCAYGHDKPSLNDLEPDLVKYLKAFNKVNLQHLKHSFNLMTESINCSKVDRARSSMPKSRSSPVDSKMTVPHFDTTSGSIVEIQSPHVETAEDSVYLFQIIKVLDSEALLFYDTGASGNLVLGAFAEKAGFKVIDSRNQRIGALGNKSLWTNYGKYKAVLGSEDDEGFELVFQGISEITSEFPPYSWDSVNKEVRASGKLRETLPAQVGGRPVDILIGIKTPELVPKLLFVMPSGIGVFRCKLRDINGSYIAYGGSHECISRVNASFASFSVNQMTIMLSRMAAEYSHLPWFSPFSSESPELPPITSLSNLQSNVFGTTPLAGDDLWDMYLESGSSSSFGCVQDQGCFKAKLSLDKKFQVLDPENDHLVTYRCEKCEDCEQ